MASISQKIELTPSRELTDLVDRLVNTIECKKSHLVRYSFDPRTKKSQFIVQHETFYDVINVDSDGIERYHGRIKDGQT